MCYRALKFEQFIPNLHPGKIISLSVKHLYTQQRENACSKSMDNQKDAQKYILKNSRSKDGVNLEPNLKPNLVSP